MRFLYTPPPSVYRHFHYEGTFKVWIEQNCFFYLRHFGTGFAMESDFFWRGFGGCEKTSCIVWCRLSKHARVVVDIGANTGIYSLMTSSVNASAKVFAFEPSKRILEKMEINKTLNNFTFQLVPIAVSNTSGNVVYYDDDSLNPYLGSLQQRSGGTSINVLATRLDDFINQSGLTSVDLIKIDVENNEPQVIEGMGRMLQLFRPAFLVEILNDSVAERIGVLLIGLEYRYFSIIEGRGVVETSTLVKGEFNNVLICTEQQFISANLEEFLLNSIP